MSERTGVQCPSCGAELVEIPESRQKGWKYQRLRCQARSCPTPSNVYTSAVSRDGKETLERSEILW